MTQIEVVDPSSRAYQFVWDNYRLCLQYCLLPFLVKIGCAGLIIILGFEDNFLRQGLVLIPAFFAEGAAICFLVIIAVQNGLAQGSLFGTHLHHPSGVGGFDQKTIMAGTILYVLIQLAHTMLVHFVRLQALASEEAAGGSDGVHIAMTVASVAALFAMMWAIRLLWLYIPVVLGFSIRRFLRVFSPMVSSFYLLGISLLCSVPAVFLYFVVSESFKSLFFGGQDSLVSVFIASVMRVFIEIFVALVTSVGVAYALYFGLSGEKKV